MLGVELTLAEIGEGKIVAQNKASRREAMLE